jgi:hypothetical protein
MSLTDSDYIEILNNTIVYIYRYGNSAIYILGIIGNLLTAFIFLKRSSRKNVCVFYFLICLLLNSIYLSSVVLGTAFIFGFNISVIDSSVILCKLLHYTAFFSSTLLPTVLILASIDRLLLSSQNLDTRLYSSKRLAYFSISISTVFWVIFNLHILIKVNIQQFSPSVFVCFYDVSSAYADFVTYSLVIFNCLFCLLMIIMSILSFKNVHRIRAIPRQQRQQIRSMTKKDFQLLRCLFVQDVVYISVSLLPSLYSIYKTVTKNQTRTSLQEAIADFLDNFFTFIYFIFCVSKAFRNELKRCTYKILGKYLNGVNINIVRTIVVPPRVFTINEKI